MTSSFTSQETALWCFLLPQKRDEKWLPRMGENIWSWSLSNPSELYMGTLHFGLHLQANQDVDTYLVWIRICSSYARLNFTLSICPLQSTIRHNHSTDEWCRNNKNNPDCLIMTLEARISSPSAHLLVLHLDVFIVWKVLAVGRLGEAWPQAGHWRGRHIYLRFVHLKNMIKTGLKTIYHQKIYLLYVRETLDIVTDKTVGRLEYC